MGFSLASRKVGRPCVARSPRTKRHAGCLLFDLAQRRAGRAQCRALPLAEGLVELVLAPARSLPAPPDVPRARRHPGWTHSTEILDPPSLSLSVLFTQPIPTEHLRAHRPMFRRHTDQHGSFAHCFDVWQQRAHELTTRGHFPGTRAPVDEL